MVPIKFCTQRALSALRTTSVTLNVIKVCIEEEMRNKRFVAAVLSAVVALGCVSAFTACKEETPPTVPPEADDGTGDGTELVLVALAIRLKSGVLKWQAVENAESYSVYYSSGGREHVASERHRGISHYKNGGVRQRSRSRRLFVYGFVLLARIRVRHAA